MEKIDRVILEMVKKDTVVALGCTEPVAVAYAASSLRKYIDEDMESMEIDTSLNIYKNGKSVYIPKTGMVGLDLAGILGYLCGNEEDGLLVLKNVEDNHIDRARKILCQGLVSVNCLLDKKDVYVDLKLRTKNHRARVVVEGGHTNIVKIEIDGELLCENQNDKKSQGDVDILKSLNFLDMRRLIEDIDIEELYFLEEGIELNKKAARMGMENKMGLGIGYTLNKLEKDIEAIDTVGLTRIMTAAAADARMSGENCPIMTSGGSGNQGLGVFLPISIVGEREKIDRYRLLRAVYFGHIVNRYVKIYTGKLSSLCGCAIASCLGSSVGITWMLGGDSQAIEGGANTILANLTGMICDGAKDTCSLKLATSASEGVLASYLALEGVFPRKNIGIVGDKIEDTIANLGVLVRDGLEKTDEVLVELI